MVDLPSRKERARRQGRITGVLVFALLMTAFTAVCSVEIIMQAFAKPPAGAPAPR